MRKNGKNKICPQCKGEFYASLWEFNKRKFCSKPCRHLSDRGKIPWNKGKIGYKYLNRKLPEPFSLEHRKNIGLGQLGRKHSTNTRLKMSITAKKKVEAGVHPFWKGGLTPQNILIRQGIEYKLWREAVFKRDDYTCQECGARNKKGLGKTVILNADHIKPFALFPELRFAIDNGATLCLDCHKKTDTFGWKIYNYNNKIKHHG